MTGAALKQKVSDALLKLKAASASVYLRKTVKTGTGAPIGKGTVTPTDTLVTPTPAVRSASQDDVQGTSGFVMLGDKIFVFSGGVTESDLAQSHVVYDSVVYKIVDCASFSFDSTIVGYKVVGRKMS